MVGVLEDDQLAVGAGMRLGDIGAVMACACSPAVCVIPSGVQMRSSRYSSHFFPETLSSDVAGDEVQQVVVRVTAAEAGGERDELDAADDLGAG